MAAVTSPERHAASLATSASNREPRRSKVHRAMEWPKPSSARSSVTMSASVRARMQTPSCSSYQFGSLTTTRFTRTRHSDIVHPVSSSQLTEARDRVRSFGGYNKCQSADTGLLEHTKAMGGERTPIGGVPVLTPKCVAPGASRHTKPPLGPLRAPLTIKLEPVRSP